MTQLTLEQQLRTASEQNARLLKILSEMDYAVPAYQQTTNYIGTLKKQIAAEERKVNLTRLVLSEHADREKYQDSVMKRLRKMGTCDEQATKEEKDWLDAIQLEIMNKGGLEQLKLNLADAEKAQAELLSIAGIRNQAHLELDEIYNQIFDGPTPYIPEDDSTDRAVRSAENDFSIVQLLLSTEKQATTILQGAEKFLTRATDEIDQAFRARNECLTSNTVAEFVKSSALGRAQSNAWQAEILLSQVQKVQPEVGHIGEMEITQEGFLTDILFGNFISDLNMRKRIRSCQNELHEAKVKLMAEITASDERQKRVQVELEQARMVLDRKRQELQRIRTVSFNRLLRDASTHIDASSNCEPELPSYAIMV